MDVARAAVPGLRLHDGIEMPQLGFGVFQLPAKETQGSVELALEAGYRHFDTAAVYGNEKGVGAALVASGLPRGDYFVTTKLWDSERGPESTLVDFEASLGRLGLDHVDLCLLHRPGPAAEGIADAWRTLESIHREEAARTIGVSGFGIGDLELLERETETRPTINQIELHPRFQQAELRAWHASHGVATEAWGPLAQGALFDDGTIVRLAERRGKTPAQVILRWHLQRGTIVISGSVTAERIGENIDLFDFELSDREMAAIGDLDRDRRVLLR
jgi:2,5-diketo-D-gluconate reductase A